MKVRSYSTSLMLLTSANIIINIEYTMKVVTTNIRRDVKLLNLNANTGVALIEEPDGTERSLAIKTLTIEFE